MTDAKIEAAARELCRMRAQDPEIIHPDYAHIGSTFALVAEIEVRRFLEIGMALTTVGALPETAGKRRRKHTAK